MNRTLNRELTLSRDEIALAVRYWLINCHDQQLGPDPEVTFSEEFSGCRITSTDHDHIELEY